MNKYEYMNNNIDHPRTVCHAVCEFGRKRVFGPVVSDQSARCSSRAASSIRRCRRGRFQTPDRATRQRFDPVRTLSTEKLHTIEWTDAQIRRSLVKGPYTSLVSSMIWPSCCARSITVSASSSLTGFECWYPKLNPTACEGA